MLYLKLFHGRKDPPEQMDDWGSDGPVFGPYDFIHTTYAYHLKMGNTTGKVDELFAFEDMIYYDGIYYGDWSVFPENLLDEQTQSLHQGYEPSKAQLPKSQDYGHLGDGEFPVKVIVYIQSGACQEVRTNLPGDSWEYGVIDYDNTPELSDGHEPFAKLKMKPLPSIVKLFDLVRSAEKVIGNWDSGDLAGAVRQMAAILYQIDSPPQSEQNRYTVFGYRVDQEKSYSTWVAACSTDEAKRVVMQQTPTIVICGIVKGWVPLN